MTTAPLNTEHNHKNCIEQAIINAKELCNKKEIRLTPLRRHVLEIIWYSHCPIGAYSIMDKLSELEKRHTAPPTVYRALDFLIEHGLVHRISSINAFIGCEQPHKAHSGQFLLCKVCNVVHEFDSLEIDNAIATVAKKSGFSLQKQTVETLGICSNCQNAN